MQPANNPEADRPEFIQLARLPRLQRSTPDEEDPLRCEREAAASHSRWQSRPNDSGPPMRMQARSTDSMSDCSIARSE